MGPFGEWARKYRKNGFEGTLPLPPGAKNPPPSKFTGSGRPHPTEYQVTQWIKGKDEQHAYSPDGNICLRLSEVSPKWLRMREDLPSIYASNNVDGWELIGIDIDNYLEKHGYEDLRELEAELGELPATAICTARWGTGSGTAYYLVPKGYRFMGKASKSIDIIQKRHRFSVVYPSTNPDANDALYLWKWGRPLDLKDVTQFEEFDGDIPNITVGMVDDSPADIVVLPEKWFNHLSRQGTLETDDPISDLTEDELIDWLKELRFDEEPCQRMQRVCAKWIERLQESASSHDKLTPAHWELLNLAAEGHSGIGWALNQFHPKWWEHVSANSGRDPETAQAEVNRSLLGALDKIQPFYNGLGRPEDTCLVDASEYATDSWLDRLEANAEAVADHDFGGLGPVIGRMPLGNAKPADEYGRHDFGNGQHLVDLYGANIRYVAARKNWIIWDGLRWWRDHEDRLMRSAFQRVRVRQEEHAIDLTYQALNNPDDKGVKASAKAWTSWAKRSGDLNPVKAALEAARSLYVEDEPVVLEASKLDGYPNLLGCANGVIDLSATVESVDNDGNKVYEPDIEVRPPCKEDYVTYNTNVEYRPWRTYVNGEFSNFEAYTIWQEYLDWFMPDIELQRFVRKVLGHMLIGENPEKKIVFLFGPPDSGKSTLIGAIAGALGDYYGTIDMGLFKHKDLNPALVRAVPLRVTGMSEAEDASKTGVIDASVVKRLTGNDKVMAELKYSNEIFEGRPQFTTIIACNNAPKITNADAALYERLLVLPLDTKIDKSRRRYERQKQIEAICGPAVLSWLIEGWIDYRREGLDRDSWPRAVAKANKAFASDLNSVSRYVAEYLEIARETEYGRRVIAAAAKKAKQKGRTAITPYHWPKAWTPEAARVYEHYRKVTVQAGQEPVDMQQFTRDLGVGRTANRKMDGRSTSVYVGVKFKEEPKSAKAMAERKW